ncbi:MAG: hypothetical protein FWG06_03225 [Clostridiales bacterium]|nr:hypothetical protein [Clostridiales bacterium]
MFDSTQPPLLVLPVTMQQTTLFSSQEGYNLHITNENRVFVSYKRGWTLPLSVQQRKFVSTEPLLLIRNKGRITSEGSTFIKGYAHQFADENGKEPAYVLKEAIFPDATDTEWTLVPGKVNMVWLQYGFKNQYCGDSSVDMEKFYYGKIMVFRFSIVEDVAPRLDKKADIPDTHEKQYRVMEDLLLNEGWSLTDGDTQQHIISLLSSHGLGAFTDAAKTALKMAGA